MYNDANDKREEDGERAISNQAKNVFNTPWSNSFEGEGARPGEGGEGGQRDKRACVRLLSRWETEGRYARIIKGRHSILDRPL